MENRVSFKQAFLFWLKLGFISFGGPAGQIAIMHEYLVEKRKWISETRFLHALNYCMLLPGPEAQQLATYIGWLMHGTVGGLIAGLLFILPSVFILLGLSIVYVTYGQTQFLLAVFNGIKPAIAAIVLLAVLKIAGKALQQKIDYIIAAGSLLALFLFNVPYPLLILATIALGVAYTFITGRGQQSGPISEVPAPGDYVISNSTVTGHTGFSVKGTLLKLLLFLLLGTIPFALFYFFTSDYYFWRGLALFFTKAALVTFGGAYSVLLYVSQVAVEKFKWLTRAEMLDGLALGETTPGPLIMVLVFVGFMGSYRHFNSIAAASLGLATTTFFTFLPSFAFILLGAPLIEKTQENKTIKKVLALVTAAVVGVVANLFLFMLKTLYDVYWNRGPGQGPDYLPFIWVVTSVVALKWGKVNMVVWIVISALFGYIFYGNWWF